MGLNEKLHQIKSVEDIMPVRAGACSDCKHLVIEKYGTWKCGAYGGDYATLARRRHEFCPQFVDGEPQDKEAESASENKPSIIHEFDGYMFGFAMFIITAGIGLGILVNTEGCQRDARARDYAQCLKNGHTQQECEPLLLLGDSEQSAESDDPESQ